MGPDSCKGFEKDSNRCQIIGMQVHGGQGRNRITDSQIFSRNISHELMLSGSLRSRGQLSLELERHLPHGTNGSGPVDSRRDCG